MARPPAPVPVEATLTRTPGWTLLNSTAMASLMGKTVLEPVTATSPLSFSIMDSVVAVGSSPHAAAMPSTRQANKRAPERARKPANLAFVVPVTSLILVSRTSI